MYNLKNQIYLGEYWIITKINVQNRCKDRQGLRVTTFYKKEPLSVQGSADEIV